MRSSNDFAQTVAHPKRFFIGGKWVSPSGTSTFNVIDPSTGETFLEIALAEIEDVDRAVAAAREAFDNGPWPYMSHRERGEVLSRVAAGIRKRATDLSGLWTSEVGASFQMSEMITPSAAAHYEYYANLPDTFEFEERHTPQMGGTGLLVFEPVGVVGAIVPWNAPLLGITHKVAPALLAGCTIILKAAPEAPAVAYVLAEIMAEAGVPDGVFNVLTADRDVSERLVRNPGVDKITFTGSSAVGKRIASICGDRLARYTLELGGKSAAIILDDYDIDAAAAAMTQAGCMMTGQVCAALSRLIVTRERHDRLVDAISSSYSALTVGDPFDPATHVGPLAMERQRDRVESYIAKGRAEGATVTAGGGRPVGLDRGYFVQPTVFANVSNTMTIAREEIFGPVLSIIPVDNEEQAIRIANDSDFGLNAAVFTHDVDRAYHVARRIRSGTVGHNGFKIDFGIAFGGFKQSGVGREGGVEGLRAFLEPKTLLLESDPRHLRK